MRILGLGLLVVLARPAVGQQSSDRAIDAVVHDACDKRVVFLGEPPMHGFGRTLELKTEIARRLITSCGFNAFFIESGAYDFLAIRTKLAAHQPITQSTVAAAIGGLWVMKEVEPLLIPARPLGADFKTARWSDVVDALVVLRQEHPPSPAAQSP